MSAMVPMASAEARQSAIEQTSAEDVRRMRFLALLCGRMANQSSTTAVGSDSGNLPPRDRSASVGGMGPSPMDVDSLPTSSETIVTNGMSAIGKGASITSSGGVDGRPRNVSFSMTSQYYRGPQNKQLLQKYTPTTPSNLSRRILHRSGVGYIDESVPLLLSSMADRFIATVLVQGMACRERRIEGYDALLRDRRKRRRHRGRVLRERRERERRFQNEVKERRMRAEDAVAESDELERQMNQNKKGAVTSSTTATSGTGTPAVFRLTDEDMEAAREYKSEARDVDAEEDYYHAAVGLDDDASLADDDIDGESDDEDDGLRAVDYDPTLRDLKLRDIIRPLRAWGFDLTGKIGFSDSNFNVDNDDDEYDVDVDEGIDDEEDEINDASDEDETGDTATTDDDETGDESGGGGRKGTKRKQSSSPVKKNPSSPRKKTKGAVTTAAKKTVTKRKREVGKEDSATKTKGATRSKAKKAADGGEEGGKKNNK